MIEAADMAALHRVAFTDSRPWSAAEFADLLAQPTVFACGDARAFALVRDVAGEAELLTIATHPDCRRQGLARGLMADWHSVALSRGARQAFLEVAADNTAARALYLACGYTETGRRPGYYARADKPPVDAVVMTRKLG